jgi:hypothetical protein
MKHAMQALLEAVAGAVPVPVAVEEFSEGREDVLGGQFVQDNSK